MAFWGVEIKPNKSFTLKFSEFQAPRFHLSQATLGSRKTDERTIVKCRFAKLPAVYVCSLLPGTTETCALDLYFDGDVTFSIKGSTSVHLVGYFDGAFDGNESGEDVEDDGYSDEEEEADSEDNSMDGFIVHGDEDDYDDDDDYDDEEWSSEEDGPTKVRKSGVIIEELLDEPSLQVTKSEVKIQERTIVPHKGGLKKSKHQEANGLIKGSVESHKDTNGDGNLKQQTVNLKTMGKTDDKHTSSSEDEDGFRVKGKRKLKDDDNEQPSKKMSTSTPAEVVHNEQPSIKMSMSTPAEVVQPAIVPAVDHEVDTDSKGSKKKKKKKKKTVSTPSSTQVSGSLETPSKHADSAKKGKVETPGAKIVSTPSSTEVSGSLETPSKHADSAKKGEGETPGSKSAAASSKQDVNKKGTVRKHPNGLEIENTSMGKPNGKQAMPGQKVGVIYTGKLRSNGKIFDSNVGKKPFFFRLGVGEVIKGWDIGVNGMRIGDKRHLTIPPNMAYGSKGCPGIPPNSWLVFTVELVEVK